MGLSHLISITGAGPGDPDLLSVKAMNRLKEADVILFDALLGEEILKLSKADANRIYVGKLYNDGQDQEERQNEIHKQLLFWANKNKRVVRLKAGDPMIFGRGAEEIRFCREKGLNYEVIPGVTAGIAAASLFDIPLTERDKNSMTLFYTGHRKDGGFSDLDTIISVLNSGSPVVVYMGLKNIEELSRDLLAKGVNTNLPLQIVSRISQQDQKSYQTNLGELSGFLKREKPLTPAIIIIGENVASI